VVELDVTHLAAGGDGIARAPDGRVVLCEGALPGERVAARVVLERRDFLLARAVSVLRASPARTVPACPHVADGCGGCTLAYVGPGPTEVALKAAIVADALRRIARLPDPAVVTAPASVPARGYRTTVRVAVDGAGRPAFRRRHDTALVRVSSCLVAHPQLEELVVDGRFEGAGSVLMRAGVAGGERIACPDRRPRRVRVPPGTVVVPVDDSRARVTEEVAGRKWRISGASFFQSGPAAAEALVGAVTRALEDHLRPGVRIVDLYAGVGLLGGALASRAPGATLVAVEANPAAAADAAHNLADLGARVRVGEVVALGTDGSTADIVLADPPRRGLGPSAAAVVASWGPEVVVLVSCDPASLGRDSRLLADTGYALDRVEVVDAFPSTVHVETVSRFRLAR
jgi:23S rRNA (uracil1939-C5)-methyltransferase